MQKRTPSIQDFLSYFEEVTPPLVITEDTISNIKDVTRPLPNEMIIEFIQRWDESIDELTEITPCFSLPPTSEYTAIVYWKASLLKYEYIMVTLDSSHTMIAKKTLCGTLIEGDIIKKSVAKIDEDLIIHIQAGAQYADSDYSPDLSQSYSIEILESGDMLFHIDESNRNNE